MKNKKWLGIVLAVAVIAISLGTYQGIVARQAPKYVVLGWNNLGMHCYNPDFSNLAILPPYNTLMAQVVKIGDPPQIVTSGVTVEYSFPDNTYSVGVKGRPDKSNFWQYARQLFGVELQPNVGLTGKGLSGKMDLAGNYFIAEGIPLTDILDRDAVNMKPYPYQKAQIVVKDSNNPKSILARLTVVAPVSTELACNMCHADDMDATTKYPITPTGKTETNILAIHDYLNGVATDNYSEMLAGRPDLLAVTPLLANQPVLCADCHSDNALGMAGAATVKSLSNAMHGHHNPDNAPDITPDTQGCYSCHPGANTQCLRDTMCQNFSSDCTNCHGDITQVAQNVDPWLIEPQCSTCHGDGYEPNLPASAPLYRESTGHGGLFCADCHDSPHAFAPSREANDTIKFMELQGRAGTLSDCLVCHATKPTTIFNHSK